MDLILSCRRCSTALMQPLLQFRTPLLLSDVATFVAHTHNSHALSASGFHINTPNPRSIHPRTPRTTLVPRRSILNDSASSPIEDANADRSFTIKKKAAEISPELKGTSVFLVGLNNSIKSNLGKFLAEALRYYYFDSDMLVEEAAGGKSAMKLLTETDEKGFRESETEVLKQLSSMGRLVVSAGNGAVQCATNLALLRHGISIWIDIPLDMVARDVFNNNLQLPASECQIYGSYSEVLGHLKMQYDVSLEGYATADSTVSLQRVASKLGYEDLDAISVEDMALEVLEEIGKLTRVKKMMEAAARPF